MTGSSSCGSATYFISDTSASNTEDTTRPASTIMTMLPRLLLRPIRNVIRQEIRPKISAIPCMPIIFPPISMASTAPKDAPLATPSVSGVASGFEKSP